MIAAVLYAALQPAQLQWQAPPECPDATQLEARARRLAIDPAAVLDGHGEVTRDPGGGYRLELAVAGRIERHSADDCTVLAELAALVVAVAADPVAVARVVPAALPMAQRDVTAAIDTTPQRARDEVTPLRASSRRSRWITVLAAHGVAGIAQLPRLDAGLDLALSIARPRFALEARGGWLSTRRTAIPGLARARAELTAADASVRACGVWRWRAIALSGCGGIELGAIVASSSGVMRPGTTAGTWVAAFGAAGLRGWVHPRVALELGADLLFALRRPSFVLEDRRQAPVTAGVGGIRGWAGLAVRLAPRP